LRVISGVCRGRRLKAPRGMATRPTADRVKEAVFNVLAQQVRGSRVLDVFAGTGALGIEALSRGADEAVFIDNNRAAWQALQDNLQSSGLWEQSSVFYGDFAKVLPRLTGGFDIIFLDPPYNQGLVAPAAMLVVAGRLLRADGVLVLETNSGQRELPDIRQLKLLKESNYGDTAVIYYEIVQED